MNNYFNSIKSDGYFDYSSLERTVREIQSKYDFIEIGNIGHSILGKSLPSISFGKGNKSVIYIGAHHGMEWITSAILMQFICDFAETLQASSKAYDISTRVLFETRRIHIIPMLNPDGIDYSIHGVSKNNVLKHRVHKMNNQSDDFTHWQANARGVDLNHNYSSGFEEYKIIERGLGLFDGAPSKFSGEYSESEPEVRALCQFVRYVKPQLALTLHTQGNEIFYTCGEKSPDKSLTLVKTISRLTGYDISIPTGTAAYGGFTDWFIDEFNLPSFTFECGLGENPLPFSDLDGIYARLKRALFTIPILI